ncbi:hypothetical protein [Pseudomonas sp. 24 E 1]|nr:hypothetical protein [Pseudomonas sp. 24 E 1]CRM75762.1 hypothetical protein [Pseudomonas sp. 35 E 8]
MSPVKNTSTALKLILAVTIPDKIDAAKIGIESAMRIHLLALFTENLLVGLGRSLHAKAYPRHIQFCSFS